MPLVIKEKDEEKQEVNKDTIAEKAIRRPQRVPIGRQDVLTVPDDVKEPGYFYRYFNDTGDRIAKAERGGYEVVKGKADPVGSVRVGNSLGVGSAVTKDVGGGQKSVLMRIKQEYYDEDQAAKMKLIKDQENEIMTVNTSDGQYGKITQEQPR